MLIVGSIFLLIIGIVRLCFSKAIYELTESWKSNSVNELHQRVTPTGTLK